MSLVNLADPSVNPGGASPSIMLTLDAATLQRLGIAQLPAGTQVFVTARAVVQNDPMNPNAPGGLQMVAMGIEPVDANAAAAQRLWGGAPAQAGGGTRTPATKTLATGVSDVSASQSASLSDSGGALLVG